MSYYPIGQAVPPPSGGSGGWGGQQGGAGGWGPPPNAGAGWNQPTGAWAAPSGYGGGQNIPVVTPQNVPTFNQGDVSDSYKKAIEYFKSMSDQDQIPEDGRWAFLALAGIDGAIDAYELQDILNRIFLSDFKFDGFGADMTRSLVAMRDYDLSGKLGFDGFRGLWTDLAWCKRAFVMFDVNKSGAFCKNEFTKALEVMGLTVTPKTHKAMLMRYTDKDGNIRFDDFVLCYIRLKTMMTIYQNKDPRGMGNSDFERDEFVQLAIYS
ncbi:hypothetical protein HELRODRAFT_191562 [Helobdella robusta]|uniref:EF-hand domain-containing protein n=1 Tax=Helobdella robusta TaxID=6412 RepID=T1FT31_HELRO|nr:hypothetical protein HELRODRAFT_191562 [Helobdella robusta]ESO05033.1 hypothetical protein HELRODRAFT_191562 [Helobdella robusta]